MAGVNDRQEILQQALNHLRSALDFLDRGSAPAEIGARVDLACHQLASYLAENFPSPFSKA